MANEKVRAVKLSWDDFLFFKCSGPLFMQRGFRWLSGNSHCRHPLVGSGSVHWNVYLLLLLKWCHQYKWHLRIKVLYNYGAWCFTNSTSQYQNWSSINAKLKCRNLLCRSVMGQPGKTCSLPSKNWNFEAKTESILKRQNKQSMNSWIWSVFRWYCALWLPFSSLPYLLLVPSIPRWPFLLLLFMLKS